MKKCLVFMFIVSMLFVSSASAIEIQTAPVPPAPTPVVGIDDNGNIDQFVELTLEQRQALGNLLAELGFTVGSPSQQVASTLEITLLPGRAGTTVSITFPFTSGQTVFFRYNAETVSWDRVSGPTSSASESPSAAGTWALYVEDNGPYDRNPAVGKVSTSYYAAAVVPAPEPHLSRGGGCSVGSISAFSALLLLFIPATIIASKKR